MNPIQKNSDQEKSENYFARKFLLRVLHLYTVSCLKKKLHSFYWIQMTWILELTSPKRVIILRNFDWFTILKIKNYASFKLFQCLQWVKETLDARLADNKVINRISNGVIYCQIWTGLPTDSRLFYCWFWLCISQL